MSPTASNKRMGALSTLRWTLDQASDFHRTQRCKKKLQLCSTETCRRLQAGCCMCKQRKNTLLSLWYFSRWLYGFKDDDDDDGGLSRLVVRWSCPLWLTHSHCFISPSRCGMKGSPGGLDEDSTILFILCFSVIFWLQQVLAESGLLAITQSTSLYCSCSCVRVSGCVYVVWDVSAQVLVSTCAAATLPLVCCTCNLRRNADRRRRADKCRYSLWMYEV